MKKFVLTVAILALCASPSFAQTGAMGLFADNQGNSCNIAVPASGPFSIYVVHKSPGGATGCEWTLGTVPASVFYGGSTVAGGYLSIGDPISGLSLAYTACVTGDFLTVTLNFFAASATPPCTYMNIVPSVNKVGVISVDCNFAEIPVVPGQGILNADGTCDCDVATQPSTWGKVKSLYR